MLPRNVEGFMQKNSLTFCSSRDILLTLIQRLGVQQTECSCEKLPDRDDYQYFGYISI